MTRIATLIIAAAAASAIAACGTAAPTTTNATETAGVLLMTTSAEPSFFDGAIRARLVMVENDSRCPIDVQCVTAGDAEAVLAIRAAGSDVAQHRLHTNREPRAVEVGGYRVRLDSLTPYPRSSVRIDPTSYRAYVTVTPVR
jgi:hypothetical protein